MTFWNRFLVILAGLTMLAGAVAIWHFLRVDGFVAFLLGSAGVCVIGKGVNEE